MKHKTVKNKRSLQLTLSEKEVKELSKRLEAPLDRTADSWPVTNFTCKLYDLLIDWSNDNDL